MPIFSTSTTSATCLRQVGQFGESAPEVVPRQDVDVGRLRALPVLPHGAPHLAAGQHCYTMLHMASPRTDGGSVLKA